MDNSKLNQTELSYESSAGTAKVNIVTGRLLYEHFDASVGLNDYNLSVSHIYNSHFELPNNDSTYMGKHWKLDIQQYLYYNDDETDTYTYIDAKGMEHTFEHLSGSEYYDTSGMGLILNVQNSEKKITDLTGNEMYFKDEKLVKIKSNEGYEKVITYEFNFSLNKTKIASMYDTRKKGIRMDFEYGSYGCLSKINIYYNGLEYSMKYYYGSNRELIYITKESKEKVEKIETMFKYNDNDLLTYSVSFLDKNGFNFTYDSDNKVSKVITGIGNIAEEISEETKPLLYVGDDIIIGENNYLGEAYNKTIYSIEGIKPLTTNDIVYNNNNVDVTNELGVTLTYFMDTENKLVSVFEKSESNYNLLSENINTKVELKEENKSNLCPKKINCLPIYKYKTSDTIVFNDATSNCVDPNLMEKFYITEGEYTFSFWLFLTAPLSNKYLVFSVANLESIVDASNYELVEKKIIINPKAVGCWQQVTITLDLSMPYFDFASIKFQDENSNCDIYLTDLSYYPNNNIKIQLKNDIEIKRINGILINNDISVNDFEYLTEKDMYLTCYRKSKIYLDKLIEFENNIDIEEKENEFENLYFPLYYNNATKAVLVNIAKYKYEDDEFNIIGNDINNDFDYKIISVSADKKIKVEKNISLLPNCSSKKINEKCFCIISNTTIKVDENEENNIVYNTYEYYDLLNRLILTIDPYGVHYYTKYTSNTITTIVEKGNLSIEKTESFVEDTKISKEGTKNISEVKYNNVTGLPLTVTEYGILKQEFFYNKHNNMLEAIKVYNIEKDEGNNIVKDTTHINKFINSEGKIYKLTDGERVYNYEYDEFGRLKSITTPNKIYSDTGTIIIDEDRDNDKILYSNMEILEDIDGSNQKNIIFTQTNNGYVDIKKYDKYGHLKLESNSGYEIEYLSVNEDNTLNEGINKKITRVTIKKNNVEEEKVILDYSENNLCKSSTYIKKHDIIEDEEHLYNLIKIENKYDDNNTTTCTIGRKINYDDESNDGIVKKFTIENTVIKDDKQQRINETKAGVIYQENIYPTSSINTIYEYDDLGRISNKKSNIKCSNINKKIKKHRNYNNFLPVKDTYIKLTDEYVELDIVENEENLFDYNYEYYDNNHNLKRITRGDLSTENNPCFSRYEYDDYNKLKEEEIALDGIVKIYTYNDDNNISNVVVKDALGNVEDEYKFYYDEKNKDLLIGYEKNNNYMSIEYDYYGKVKKFIQGDTERVLTWDQGKFLTKITNPNNEVIYKYDYLGRRISKEYDTGEKVEYYYNGNQLVSENIYMKKYVINLSYMYEQNEVIGFSLYKTFSKTEYSTTTDTDIFDNLPYNTFNTYYYIKDILGNITAITDGTEIIVKYNYDAWGNHKFYTNPNFTAIALLNPFRYRGYFYDVETGWFWLSSRYYSPELCRWISPDSIEYLDPESVNGLNLYCYCKNNPIMYADPLGHIAISALLLGMAIGFGVGFAIGGGFEIGKQIYANGWNPGDWDWGQIGLSALGGGVAGAISSIPTGTGLVGYFLAFFTGGIGSALGGWISGSVTSLETAGMAFLIGGTANVLGKGVTDIINKIKVGKNISVVANKANKIASMSAKKKSLAIWEMIGMDNFSRNAYKSWGYDQVLKLLMTEANNQLFINSANGLTRYIVYSALISSFGSGWY